MEGKILAFDTQKQTGLIRGNDENRYSFHANELGSQSPIRVGATVDFKIDGENAIEIYLIKNSGSIDIISNFGNEEALGNLSEKAKQLIIHSVQNDNHNPLGVAACVLATTLTG